MAKLNTVSIGQYLLAKDNKTKYLKLEAKPNADERTKKLVADLIAVLGGDVIFVNLYDQEFKDKYKIRDFVKGRIEVEVKDGSNPAPVSGGSSASNDEVNF